MELSKLYTKIMERVAQGARNPLKLEENDLLELASIIQKKDPDLELNKQILSIATFVNNYHPIFEEHILYVLSEIKESELLIFALHASHKQIITRRMRNSERVPAEFISKLSTLLNHPDLEVVEWVLRTIDQAGNQMIRLKPEILKIKPLSFTFNRRKKIIRELILHLEKSWSGNV